MGDQSALTFFDLIVIGQFLVEVLPDHHHGRERAFRDDRRELDFRRALYAAQIDRFDQNVGRIVADRDLELWQDG